MITKADAYDSVQREIDRRVREGRSIGQLKTNHIHVVENQKEFQRIIDEKIA